MKNHGPWKIKSSEVKYENPWLSVREDQVIQPDGTDGIYGVVTVKNGSRILPIDDHGNAYLAQQFHYGWGDMTIAAIAGAIDGDETPPVAAKRELEEELGIQATEWISLGMVAGLPTYMHHEENLFIARGLTFITPQEDKNETIKVLKMPVAEAVAMVMDGRVINAQSCALILKAAKYLGKI